MAEKLFSVQEANALLPQIRPLMAELLAIQARVAAVQEELSPLLRDAYQNIGNRQLTQLAQDFELIERHVREIRAMGCVVKDLRAGLVDFPARLRGRQVELCWRYGEERVEYYHDINAGFANRKRIE